MSFGDKWVAFRNEVEAAFESELLALEPAAKTALVTAVNAAEAAALAVLKSGSITASGLLTAAFDAAKTSLAAQGVSIGEALLQQSIAAQINPATVTAAPAS